MRPGILCAIPWMEQPAQLIANFGATAHTTVHLESRPPPGFAGSAGFLYVARQLNRRYRLTSGDNDWFLEGLVVLRLRQARWRGASTLGPDAVK